MRFELSLSAALAAGLIVIAPARADNSPWYISGSFGGYFREGTSGPATFNKIVRGANVSAPGTNSASFDPGLIGNAAIGYQLTPEFRIETELGYFEYSADTLNPLTLDRNFPRLDGSTFRRQTGSGFSRFSGTINGFYDFPALGAFTPYVGAGLGAAADHRTTGRYIGPAGTYFTAFGGASTEGVALIEGGVSIALTDNLSIVPAYRYVRFMDDNEDTAHVVKIGLRYGF